MRGNTNVRKLSIALSGCGHAGLSHGREIVACNDWNLAAVCDVREEAARETARELGGARTYTDYEAMLDAEALDAVAIITPAHVHVPQVMAAAARGVHVLCEKPLGITVEECENAVAACRAAGVLLGVTYTYHFIPDFRLMKQIVDSGEIGDVREVRWLNYGGPPPEPERERPEALPEHHQLAKIPHLFDCGVHAWDLMSWFVGQAAVDIKGHAIAPGPGWEPRPVTLIFTYAGGQRGICDLGSMTALPGCEGGMPAISFLVCGTRGSMVWDYRSGWAERRMETRISIHTDKGTRFERVPIYSKCRDVQYAEFAQAVREGRLPPHWPTGEAAIEATRMACAAIEAIGRDTLTLNHFERPEPR